MNFIEKRNQRMIDAGWLYRYDFDFGVMFPYNEVVKWCRSICVDGNEVTYAGTTFWFKNPEHYTWFILRWS